MIELGGQRIWIGGFHDHWVRADNDNPSLLLAALTFYHYDFCVLMDGQTACARWADAAKAYCSGLRIYPGHEVPYSWGHVVTIAPHAEPPGPDETDPRRVLARLNQTCELALLAHPAYPSTWEEIFTTGELDRWLDEGVVAGIELTVEGFDSGHARNAELVTWYDARQRAGLRTPIVGGWDVHMARPVANLPSVLYTSTRPPDGHYEAPCSNRTLVFAAENSLAAIKAAVLDGRSVIEAMPSGRLVGPPDLVAHLERHGYHEAMRERDARRDALLLERPEPLIAGRRGRLVLATSTPGNLKLPRTFAASDVVPSHGGEVMLPTTPALLERDYSHLPVGWQGQDGVERVWAVQVEHPIRFEVLPCIVGPDQRGPAVELRPLLPFDGTVQLTVEELGIDTVLPVRDQTFVPVESSRVSDQPVTFTMQATDRCGLARRYEGFLTFLAMPRFGGDWSTVPTIGVDQPRYVPRSAYGKRRPWPGPQVFSAQLQFAWDERAFRFRAQVRDAVHYQPYRGHYAYNADCLQLALDPMLRREPLLGKVYTFNLILSPEGPELFRTDAPEASAAPGFVPPKPNQSLGDRYLTVTPWDGGLCYELTLPWEELAPFTDLPVSRPVAGHRMGVYYIMFNNDGQGHLDTLHWPVPIYGMWQIPARWGVLTLTDG